MSILTPTDPPVQIALFVASMTSVVCAAIVAARTLLRGQSLIGAITSATIIGYSIIVAAGLLTGMTSLLTAVSLHATALALSVVIIVWCRLTSLGNIDDRPARLTAAQPKRLLHGPRGALLRRICVVMPVVYLLLVVLIRSLTAALTTFPTDWDTLMYHLPLVDLWATSGHLVATACPRWSDPANNELVSLFLVVTSSGDFFATFTNGLSVLILFGSLQQLLATLRVHPAVASPVALCIVCNYTVIRQMIDCGNDVATAAFVVASTLYGMRILQSKRIGYTIMYGITLGILSGIKYVALPYAVASAIVISVMAVALRRAPLLPMSAAIFGGVLLFGVPWYARNAIVSGSPLFPFGITEATNDFVRTRPTGLFSTSIIGAANAETAPLLLVALFRYYGLSFLWGLSLYLPASIWLWKSRKGLAAGKAHASRYCVLVSLTTWLLLICTPFSAELEPGALDRLRHGYSPMRFGLSSVALSIAVACAFATKCWRAMSENTSAEVRYSHASRMWYGDVGAVLIVVAVAQCIFVQRLKNPVCDAGIFLGCAVIGLLLTVIVTLSARSFVGSMFVAGKQNGAAKCSAFVAAMVVSFIIVWYVTGLVSERWHRDFDRFYIGLDKDAVYELLAHYEEQHPEAVICACRMKYYPFFGSSRSRRIVRPGKFVSEEEVVHFVIDNKCDIVVAWDDDPILHFYRYVEQAMAKRPSQFKCIYKTPAVAVFEVLKRDGVR
jgi:hypothetical protein